MVEKIEKFKLWSEACPAARELLSPNLGLREWHDLSLDENFKVWDHLKKQFTSDMGSLFVHAAIDNFLSTYKNQPYTERYSN